LIVPAGKPLPQAKRQRFRFAVGRFKVHGSEFTVEKAYNS
jgi:hypothetical protein